MRKEFLLGTTALLVGAVAAPDYVSAAEPLRLQVRGFKNEFFGVGNVDVDGKDFNNTGEFSEGEVQFRGETALDNGLTVGVQIEMEADSRSDPIDEAYAYIQGDFGRIVAGGENLANYNTFWGVTAPGVGVPINSGWITTWVPAPASHDSSFRSTKLTTNIDVGNDENSISYYSPRFAGFQFTGGYVPSVVDTGEGKTFSGFEADEATEYHNAWGVGVNFSESFNGVDITVAGGYNQIDEPDNVRQFGADEVQQVKAGANLGFAGFSIGGSYAAEFEGKIEGVKEASTTTSTSGITAIPAGGSVALSGIVGAPGAPAAAVLDANGDALADETTTTTTTPATFSRDEEGESWDAGASYATGPWGVSVTYFHGEWEGDPGGGQDETDSVVGAVSYALGPGITSSLSVLWGQFENDDSGSNPGAEGEAVLGIIGLAVKF